MQQNNINYTAFHGGLTNYVRFTQAAKSSG